MKELLISKIIREMLPYLDNTQMKCLQEVLSHCFWGIEVSESEEEQPLEEKLTNHELLGMFLAAKRLEGCSEKTIKYYSNTLSRLFSKLDMHVMHMKTEDLRKYLSDYQQASQCSKANIDNIRRILSSFFAWLEDENYIIKSPVRRIHKIKSCKTVKETYSDESLEIMRDQCGCLRDLALIDLLASTGMRVGELVRLNRADIDFENRECVVFGKGSKERPVYFDARTKIHLKNYLDSRTDDNPALFVSLMRPFNRLEISGVEIRLRALGRKLGISKVHPHKFRRTLATRAIDKGMPIEQVQRLLGHAKIDTTMQYAMVNQNNVKISHRKYIG
jgi:site-specific recombinase XerD